MRFSITSPFILYPQMYFHLFICFPSLSFSEREAKKFLHNFSFTPFQTLNYIYNFCPITLQISFSLQTLPTTDASPTQSHNAPFISWHHFDQHQLHTLPLPIHFLITYSLIQRSSTHTFICFPIPIFPIHYHHPFSVIHLIYLMSHHSLFSLHIPHPPHIPSGTLPFPGQASHIPKVLL